MPRKRLELLLLSELCILSFTMANLTPGWYDGESLASAS